MLLAILVSSVVDTSTYEIILEYIDSHVTFYMHCAQFSNVELCLKIRKYPNTSTIILNRYIYRCSSKKKKIGTIIRLQRWYICNNAYHTHRTEYKNVIHPKSIFISCFIECLMKQQCGDIFLSIFLLVCTQYAVNVFIFYGCLSSTNVKI